MLIEDEGLRFFNENSVEVSLKKDLDLEKTILSGQCFRPAENNSIFRFINGNMLLYIKKDSSPNSFRILAFSSKETPFILNESPLASGDRSSLPIAQTVELIPRLSCKDASIHLWENVWQDYFDLSTDYSLAEKKVIEAFREKIFDEKALHFLLDSLAFSKGIHILRQDPFETVISFIISQRKSIPAIKTSIEKLCQNFGEKICSPLEKEIFLFPSPSSLASVSTSELSQCSLGYRVPYIKDASEKFLTGEISPEKLSLLSDDELLLKLQEVKGIGKKVSNCIGLFSFHRTKLCPVDTWIGRIIDQVFSGTDPFPFFKEYSGIIQQYIFYYVISNKNLFS